MQEWIIGGLIALAAPLGIKWAGKRSINFLAHYLSKKLLVGLKGEGLEDEDVKAFLHDVTLSFIRLAERKLPDQGLGPERKKWMLDFLLSRLPFLKQYESTMSELIDELVKQNDQQLKDLLKS